MIRIKYKSYSFGSCARLGHVALQVNSIESGRFVSHRYLSSDHLSIFISETGRLLVAARRDLPVRRP